MERQINQSEELYMESIEKNSISLKNMLQDKTATQDQVINLLECEIRRQNKLISDIMITE